MASKTGYTNDAQNRAKIILIVNPTSTGANWSVEVADNSSNYGGYAASAGSWSATIAGSSIFSESGKSYDFGSGVISNPYFPRTKTGSVTLSPGTYSASATFSGDGSTVGTANASLTFTITATTYAVTIAPDNGSSSYQLGSYASGASVAAPAAPTKSGYTFNYWVRSDTGGTVSAGGSFTMPAAALTLTANWSAVTPPPPGGGTTYYSYSYNSNGGSSTPSGSGSIASGTAITLGSPGTKTGYSFAGWYTDSGLTSYAGGIGASYAITSNLVFYAKWTTSTSTLPSWPVPLPTLSQFIAGQPYTDSITAANMSAYNGVYSISAGSLPGGVSINSATGELSGTVSTATDYSFTVTATNDSGSITQNYSGNITGIMRVRQSEGWVKAIAKKREGQIWKPGTVRVWSNGTWLYGS